MSVSLTIELSAVVVTIKDNEAMVLCLNLPDRRVALPSGPFMPEAHRTFDLAVRAFVTEQTGFSPGYVEQLYSFGDEGRQGLSSLAPEGPDEQQRVISLGYLALTSDSAFQSALSASWRPYSAFFPWEDWRKGEPATLSGLRQALRQWCDDAPDRPSTADRRGRIETLFPADADHWNEERVLDRYELLYSAGLIGESARPSQQTVASGCEMMSDHRRILATGLSRLRGKLKYRPVIFELMPERFTLLELQKSLEAVSGFGLHKQNFRRALERTGFVTPTAAYRDDTGGRPAELYAYNRDQFRFSPSLGLSLPRA
ncbi:NAD regulator [Asticcacaulis sp. YBE204]|uniref:NUDIX hydrolase n=1 Tax=Asticcacaulis sp. YBE204 TaxID=1282363 RepID=UPI0003C3F653|nr:NAD regulator [Asticcacaulis sp. YBE204]ESQ80440.1 NAD regulator [Asticcacaulis sp. YBE204]